MTMVMLLIVLLALMELLRRCFVTVGLQIVERDCIR